MATKINLLDWRAELRELRKRQFGALMGLGAVVAAGVVVLAWITAGNAVDGQRARNDYLKQQITETEQKIKEIEDLEKTKANLLARMRVIEELQGSRSGTVHFFDDLVNTLPDGVNITSVKQQGGSVTLDGVAESNGRVSTYMKNLDASPWFADPELVVIKTVEQDKQRKSEFTLKVKNLTKGQPAEESAP